MLRKDVTESILFASGHTIKTELVRYKACLMHERAKSSVPSHTLLTKFGERSVAVQYCLSFLTRNCKSLGSAALPRKRTPDHSHCHHHHPYLVGC